MKETLIDIVQDIDSCATARRGTSIYPVARVHCNFDGKSNTYWFTNEYKTNFEYPEIKKHGNFVPKNSKLAIIMQTMNVGESYDYDQKNYIKRMQHHHVVLENRSDFQNQTIAIAGDPLLYQYRNIKEFLSSLQQNIEDIKEVETKIAELQNRYNELKKVNETANERGQITKSINGLQREYRILTQQQEDLKNITIYIRKQGEMRYSLIVDTIQTRIKSQNLFDGKTLIINGGPGTGKSTTMIHRLAYLTDTFAIKEDADNRFFNFKLDSSQRNQLFEAVKNNRDWMFFSPSQMLRQYLAAAMTKEGLTNTYEKVWNWKDYCRMIMQANYHLIGNDKEKAPFRISYLTGTLFFQGSNIVRELMDFYLNELRAIKNQLPEIKTDGTVYEWTAIAMGIRQRLDGSESFDLTGFVSLFNSLESLYGADCKKLIKKKNDVIAVLTDEVCALLDENSDAKSDIEELLDISSEDDELLDNMEEDDISEENESEADASNGLKNTDEDKKDPNAKLQSSIAAWLRAYSYGKVNNKIELSDDQELINEVLLPLLGDLYDAKIQKLGEMMVFEHYAQYARGAKTILLNGIPARYKKFRTYLLRSQYNGCDLKLLRDVMQRKKGKELHHQEMSLLLGFINTVVKQLKATNSTNVKHPYIEAYEEVARPIIGIDEATDFSVCDIYAMQSLLLREFSSLTLCGDMMQRLTTYGLKSWSELNGIVSEPVVVEMKTSYRQSKKLLEVAREMYRDTLGETPTYKAFMKSNKVPDPLVYVNVSEHSKIEWIAKRIAEVYRAYGEQLPSIAIFVNDKGYIPKYIDNLKRTEFFTKNAIEVLDGSSDKQKKSDNHIGVYPIEVVKGMEFDVVFFHNIDNSSVDTEILKRYIYVGVSRAAFFLAITLSEQNNEITKYFGETKDWLKI